MFKKDVIVIVFIKLLTLQDTTSINVNRAHSSITNSRDSDLNFSQLALKYGYISEQHSVVTDDGYILTTFKMRGKHCERRGPPVLMMHGILQSSDAFLDAGPENGLAYLLADSCYDVWVGNSRGNYYSRAHITLNPDKDETFWKFSSDEMGYYDIPATIDYILDNTGDEKLNYIGYSQGGALGFIMCSERPAYCGKINIFLGLAPASRLTNVRSSLSRVTNAFYKTYEKELAVMGIHEVSGKPASLPDLLSIFCQLNFGSVAFCRTALSLLDSYHPRSISYSTVKTLYGHFMAGTSVHNFAKNAQSNLSNDFRKFDYGADNIKIYGSKDPPSYNLNATTVPVMIIYGENDRLVDAKDIEWSVSQLPNVLEVWRVPDPLWNHMDFVYSQHTGRLIFPKIQEYLLQYSQVIRRQL